MLGGEPPSPLPLVPGGGAGLKRKGAEWDVCLSVGPGQLLTLL